MILIDANLLIYAVNRDAALHAKAKAWLKATLAGTAAVGLPENVLLAFLRLTTRQGLFRNPLPLITAFDMIDGWLSLPNVVLVEPTTKHFRVLRDLLSPLGVGGNLVSDAHLAALAIEHGAELCTCDNDFSRFARLRWRNPLL